jgi:hypothetical protein
MLKTLKLRVSEKAHMPPSRWEGGHRPCVHPAKAALELQPEGEPAASAKFSLNHTVPKKLRRNQRGEGHVTSVGGLSLMKLANHG